MAHKQCQWIIVNVVDFFYFELKFTRVSLFCKATCNKFCFLFIYTFLECLRESLLLILFILTSHIY